jgi:hypothetical protein
MMRLLTFVQHVLMDSQLIISSGFSITTQVEALFP